MPKPEWGTKRLCPETGKRFYDLNKDPILNPYTGKTMVLEEGGGGLVAASAEGAGKSGTKTPTATAATALDDGDDVRLDDLGDDVLEEEDEDTVSLDDIAGVAANEEDS